MEASTNRQVKKYALLAGIVASAISCKLQPESGRSFDKDKVYKLQVSPAPGSVYQYEISNQTDMGLEVEGKEVSALNKADVELNYAVTRDSTGNYLFTTTYDKIKLYSKSGDKETEMNADNAMVTIDPIEKMLGVLKSARITATVNQKGEIIDVSGYKELGEKFTAGFDEDDQYGRSMAQQQWEKTIGKGVVKNNLEQLFKVFPDSAIHIGDTWKINSIHEGELPMTIKSIYTLKAINDDIAVISAEGILTSNGASNSVMGYKDATAVLNGEQKAEFEIETKTGMLINGRITTKVEGKLQMMGREIPVKVKSSVKMNGNKR